MTRPRMATSERSKFAADARTLIDWHEGLRLKLTWITRGKWTIG